MPSLLTKPKRLNPNDSTERQMQQIADDIMRLWRRVSEFEKKAVEVVKTIAKLTKNWRLREEGTDWVVERLTGGVWTEEARLEP